MILRVKDFRGDITAIRDCERLFGDRFGDDYLASAETDDEALQPAQRRFKFVASDDSVDLDDEIIAEGAFHELRGMYLRRPSILVSHQHRLDNGLSAVAAKTVQLQTEKNPVWGIGEFVDTAVGRDHAAAVLSGAQKGISVGFRSRDIDRSSGRVVHTKALLLEISLVAVPANPNALVLEYAAGKLARHGQATIRDPGQARDWEAMLLELRGELDALKAVIDPGPTEESEEFKKFADAMEEEERPKWKTEGESEEEWAKRALEGEDGEFGKGWTEAERKHSEAEIAECLGGFSRLADSLDARGGMRRE